MSGHEDGTVRHWDISAQGNASEEHRSLALFHNNPLIRCIALSACSKLALYCSEKGVQKWDTLTGEALVPLIVTYRVVWCLAMSKDGTLIVNVGYDSVG